MKKNEKNFLKYARAPYNFIKFPSEVKYIEKKLPDHNKFYENLKTGYIEYEIKNETSLFIGAEKNENESSSFEIDNKKVIPGSTMRGKIRSNAEILSFSYPHFIDKARFTYRDLAGETVLKEEYSKRLLLNEGSKNINYKVKVGVIKRINEKYILYPSKKIKFIQNEEEKEKRFFTIDEFRLKEELGNNISGVRWMYNKELPKKIKILENKLTDVNAKIKELYEENNIDENRRKDIGIDYRELAEKNFNEYEKDKFFKNLIKKYGLNEEFIEEWREKIEISINKINDLKNFLEDKKNQNSDYRPYETKIKLSIEEKDGKIIKIQQNQNLNTEVKLYNSAYISGKRKHYVVPLEDNTESEGIKIPDDIIYQYKKELNRKKLNDNYNLPDNKDKNGKIFFYKEENEKLIGIGRTPYLRLAYDKTVTELLGLREEKEKIDYVESIFGFTDKNKIAYKGRISFTDLKSSNAIEGKEVELILLKPHPTSFQLYLKQASIFKEDQNNLDLNTLLTKSKNKKKTRLSALKSAVNLEIKDYKNYKKELLTYNADTTLRGQKFYWLKPVQEDSQQKNKNIKTKLKPIKEGATFKGRIYFENLEESELGLLLLSLKYNKDTKENIGMGKPYGYGRITVEKIQVWEENKKESFSNFFKNNYEDVTAKIENYKSKFKNVIDSKNYDNLEIIKEYLSSKSIIIKENKKLEVTHQMISGNEFKLRYPLPNINEFIRDIIK